MSGKDVDRKDHWAVFYKTQAHQSKYNIPSQFSAFIAQEVDPSYLMIDIGCGNGRDSIFFAQHGFQVVAIDASENGLSVAADIAGKNNITSIAFDQVNVGEKTLAKTLEHTKGKKKLTCPPRLPHS